MCAIEQAAIAAWVTLGANVNRSDNAIDEGFTRGILARKEKFD